MASLEGPPTQNPNHNRVGTLSGPNAVEEASEASARHPRLLGAVRFFALLCGPHQLSFISHWYQVFSIGHCQSMSTGLSRGCCSVLWSATSSLCLVTMRDESMDSR